MCAYPVADLHSDLLGYLGVDPARTIFDPGSRCPADALHRGGVRLQVLPVFVSGLGDPVAAGQAQLTRFARLLAEHPQHFVHASRPAPDAGADAIAVLLAIENASAFFSASEPFADGLARLDAAARAHGPLAYLSLTWSHENRFGGGNYTPGVGLKDDGRRLLAWLAEHRVAVDLSHTSDALAHDILTFVETEAPELPVVASHSNLRAVNDVARNLPDELAGELARHGGVCGLNLVYSFVGRRAGVEQLADHIRHALSLGLAEQLCLGADFFCETDLPDEASRRARYFFDGFGRPDCHPQLQAVLREALAGDAGAPDVLLAALTHGNLVRHFERRGLLAPSVVARFARD